MQHGAFLIPLAQTYSPLFIIVFKMFFAYIENHIKQCCNFASNRIWKTQGEKKVYCVCLYFYSLRCSLAFLMFQGLFKIISYLFQELPLAIHYFRISLLKTNSLTFPSSENVLISFSFLKDIFTGYIEFWVDRSFSTWRKMYKFLWLSWLLTRNLPPSEWSIFPYKWGSVFLSLLSICFLCV